MQAGEKVLFYHSGEHREIVGVAQVRKVAYPDPTATEGDWVAVDLVPVKPLAKALPLAELKADTLLKGMAFVRQSRLSVSPVSTEEFSRILKLSATKL